MILRATPLLKGDQTVIEVFKEKEENKAPERNPKWTMSKDEMKAIFDNLVMGASRRAEQEWDWESSTTKEADSIEIKAQASRPSTPMHVTDWAQAQQEDLELEAALEWCVNDKKKGIPWAKQLENWKHVYGLWNTNLRVNVLSEILIS